MTLASIWAWGGGLEEGLYSIYVGRGGAKGAGEFVKGCSVF